MPLVRTPVGTTIGSRTRRRRSSSRRCSDAKPLGATSLGEQHGTKPVGTPSEAVEVAPPTDDDVVAWRWRTASRCTRILPRSLRPARRPSPAGDGAATEACACSACLEQEASPSVTQTGLGQPPPAHLRGGCPALPLWWPPAHHRHPLHAQGGRGAPHPARPPPVAAAPPPARHRPACLAARWLR